jgi:bifunctional apoptosis regulator
MLIRLLAGAAGEDIALKPVQSWSTDDVATWIASLGSWAQNKYLEKFRIAEVNGRLLLLIDEKGLEELSVNSSLHRKAFIEAIEQLQTKGVRLANNLWEFKTAYRQHTMWVTIGLTSFPRLLIIYSYWYNYDDTYLPFVHYMIPPSDENPDSDIDETLAKFAPPSWRQSIDFWFKVFVIPYYLIGSFVWGWMLVHFWIALVVLLYSVAMSLTEAALIPTIFKHPRHKVLDDLLPGYCLKCLFFSIIRLMISQTIWQFVFWWLIMAILWHIMPAFLCDIGFYWLVYMSPVRACFSAFKSIQGMMDYQLEA